MADWMNVQVPSAGGMQGGGNVFEGFAGGVQLGAALRDMRDSNRQKKALDAITGDKSLGPMDKLKAYAQVDIPTASDYAVFLQNAAAVEKAYDPEYRQLEKEMARAQASAARGQSAAAHALARHRNIQIKNAQLELDMRKSMSDQLAVQNATGMIGAVAEARTTLVGELLRMPEDVRAQFFDLHVGKLYKGAEDPAGRQIFSSVFVGPSGELDFSDENLGTVIDKSVNSAEQLSRLAGEAGITAEDRTAAQNNFIDALENPTYSVDQVWRMEQSARGAEAADINAASEAGQIPQEQILDLLLQRFKLNTMNDDDLIKYKDLLDNHFTSLEGDPTAVPEGEEPGWATRQKERLQQAWDRLMRRGEFAPDPNRPPPNTTPISEDLGLGGA